MAGMGWFWEVEMIKALFLPSASSQAREGNGHLNKTLQCRWTSARVEALRDAVCKRERQ